MLQESHIPSCCCENACISLVVFSILLRTIKSICDTEVATVDAVIVMLQEPGESDDRGPKPLHRTSHFCTLPGQKMRQNYRMKHFSV